MARSVGGGGELDHRGRFGVGRAAGKDRHGRGRLDRSPAEEKQGRREVDVGGWSGWGGSHLLVTIERMGRLDLSKKY